MEISALSRGLGPLGTPWRPGHFLCCTSKKACLRWASLLRCPMMVPQSDRVGSCAEHDSTNILCKEYLLCDDEANKNTGMRVHICALTPSAMFQGSSVQHTWPRSALLSTLSRSKPRMVQSILSGSCPDHCQHVWACTLSC